MENFILNVQIIKSVNRIIPIIAMIILFVVASSRAQQRAHSVPESQEKSPMEKLTALTNYLQRGVTSDQEKIRKFYNWIANHVAYDTDYLFHQDESDACVSLDCVLTNKETVCAGYANLFHQMCKLAGIKSEIIEGYAKGFDYTPGQTFERTNHAWNAVRLNGKWHLLDITWGAGKILSNKKFVFEYDERHFLMDPKEFILTHLPADPIFQLLESPVPVSVFEKNEITIKEHLDKTPARLDYEKSLLAHYSTPETERNFKSAQRAYKFNPNNKFDYAFASLTYADAITENIGTRSLSDQGQAQLLQKAKDQYKNAVKMFGHFQDETSKHNLLYCYEQAEALVRGLHR